MTGRLSKIRRAGLSLIAVAAMATLAVGDTAPTHAAMPVTALSLTQAHLSHRTARAADSIQLASSHQTTKKKKKKKKKRRGSYVK